MARLHDPKPGVPLAVRGLNVEYSFWPTTKTKRWTLQRRLYVKHPWAILFEAVYRHKPKLPKNRVDECLSYLGQAEEYFNAAAQLARIDVKPVLLYYSLMNLAKCLIAVRNPALDMSRARHGLSANPKGKAVLGDRISVKKSATNVNVFDDLTKATEGHGASLTDLEVRDLLAQVVPGHRLWTYARHATEKFLAISHIEGYTDTVARSVWLRLKFNRAKIRYVTTSMRSMLRSSRLPGLWQQANSPDGHMVLFEQATPLHYAHRPVDSLDDLFRGLRSAVWCTVTSSPPHRKYYLLVDPKLGAKRLPQWASMYVLFFYFSDLTRYRPNILTAFSKASTGLKLNASLTNALGNSCI